MVRCVCVCCVVLFACLYIWCYEPDFQTTTTTTTPLCTVTTSHGERVRDVVGIRIAEATTRLSHLLLCHEHTLHAAEFTTPHYTHTHAHAHRQTSRLTTKTPRVLKFDEQNGCHSQNLYRKNHAEHMVTTQFLFPSPCAYYFEPYR